MGERTIIEAVDQLVYGKRILLFRDETGRNIRGDVPSLIEQLEAAVSREGRTQGSGGSQSRPPIAVGVASLLIEISTTAARVVKEAHGKHLHNVAENLKRLAADRANLPAGDEDLEYWIDQLNTWTAKARTALGIEPKYPAGLRGIPCPTCGADSVGGHDDVGESTRVPALQFDWSQQRETADDELPADRTVRAVVCRMCGATWWAGEQFYQLQAQIEQVIAANLTRETLAQ